MSREIAAALAERRRDAAPGGPRGGNLSSAGRDLSSRILRPMQRLASRLWAHGGQKIDEETRYPPGVTISATASGHPPSHDAGSRGNGTDSVPKPLTPPSSRYCRR